MPAVSQLFIRSSPRSRWKFPTCFSTTFIPGYFATTLSTAFVRSCAPFEPSSPTMIGDVAAVVHQPRELFHLQRARLEIFGSDEHDAARQRLFGGRD